jgi:hypothetical protein
MPGGSWLLEDWNRPGFMEPGIGLECLKKAGFLESAIGLGLWSLE